MIRRRQRTDSINKSTDRIVKQRTQTSEDGHADQLVLPEPILSTNDDTTQQSLQKEHQKEYEEVDEEKRNIGEEEEEEEETEEDRILQLPPLQEQGPYEQEHQIPIMMNVLQQHRRSSHDEIIAQHESYSFEDDETEIEEEHHHSITRRHNDEDDDDDEEEELEEDENFHFRNRRKDGENVDDDDEEQEEEEEEEEEQAGKEDKVRYRIKIHVVVKQFNAQRQGRNYSNPEIIEVGSTGEFKRIIFEKARPLIKGRIDHESNPIRIIKDDNNHLDPHLYRTHIKIENVKAKRRWFLYETNMKMIRRRMAGEQIFVVIVYEYGLITSQVFRSLNLPEHSPSHLLLPPTQSDLNKSDLSPKGKLKKSRMSTTSSSNTTSTTNSPNITHSTSSSSSSSSSSSGNNSSGNNNSGRSHHHHHSNSSSSSSSYDRSENIDSQHCISKKKKKKQKKNSSIPNLQQTNPDVPDSTLICSNSSESNNNSTNHYLLDHPHHHHHHNHRNDDHIDGISSTPSKTHTPNGKNKTLHSPSSNFVLSNRHELANRLKDFHRATWVTADELNWGIWATHIISNHPIREREAAYKRDPPAHLMNTLFIRSPAVVDLADQQGSTDLLRVLRSLRDLHNVVEFHFKKISDHIKTHIAVLENLPASASSELFLLSSVPSLASIPSLSSVPSLSSSSSSSAATDDSSSASSNEEIENESTIDQN